MKILLSGFCLLSFLSLSAQDSLTILFAGDAMMHQKQLDNTRRGDFFDLDSYFANIEREVKAVDIAVVNFEVPLGGEPYSGYPAFSAPENFALALQKAGFDFFLLANNHCFCYDHGGKIDGGYVQNYGYIVETEHYRYCLRCNPSPGDYNGYLLCAQAHKR